MLGEKADQLAVRVAAFGLRCLGGGLNRVCFGDLCAEFLDLSENLVQLRLHGHRIGRCFQFLGFF